MMSVCFCSGLVLMCVLRVQQKLFDLPKQTEDPFSYFIPLQRHVAIISEQKQRSRLLMMLGCPFFLQADFILFKKSWAHWARSNRQPLWPFGPNPSEVSGLNLAYIIQTKWVKHFL